MSRRKSTDTHKHLGGLVLTRRLADGLRFTIAGEVFDLYVDAIKGTQVSLRILAERTVSIERIDENGERQRRSEDVSA